MTPSSPRGGALARTGTPPRPATTRPRAIRRRGGWLLGALVAVLLVVTAPAAHAEAAYVLAQASSVTQVLNNVRGWLMGILAALATVFLTVGGVRYVLAAGDPSEVEKAKQAFRSAGWGYALAALAPLVVDILARIVGA
ncbi:pilin [Prauserella oleivorans]|uniref:Pilin n=1 Tax=Prauserella oleivorans TaxID=1478153 RepID=A0ABW5WI50_9PSEU